MRDLTESKSSRPTTFQSSSKPSHRYIQHSTTYEAYTDYGIHYHEYYELYYFVEGDVDYMVEGKVYHLTPHSLLLLSPYSFHGVRVNSDAPYTRYFVYFSPEVFPPEHRKLLLSCFPDNQKNSPKEVFYEHTENYNLLLYLKNLVASQKQPRSIRNHYFDIYTCALLAQINLMSQALRPSPVTNTGSQTIAAILDYINAHANEDITLDILSERFFISKHYLNRAFKKATGTTVIDYVIYKRTIHARQLLYNGHSATEAGLASGFHDYSSFYRAYKKTFGCSPKQDRKS